MADLYNILDGLNEGDETENNTTNELDDNVSNDGGDIHQQQQEEGEEWDQPEEVDMNEHVVTLEEENAINNTAGLGLDTPLDLDDFQVVEEKDHAYSKLHAWWVQERRSPELLHYDSETMQTLVDRLESSSSSDGRKHPHTASATANNNTNNIHVQSIIQSIQHIDQERVQFLIADVTRLRLEKIEQHALFLRNHTDRMSAAEVDFLKGYGMLLERHLRTTVLDHHVDPAFGKLDESNMIDSPDTDRYVFCRVRQREQAILQDHAFSSGQCLIAPYRLVQPQLVGSSATTTTTEGSKGSVELV